MFEKEVTKIGLTALVGLVIGAFCAFAQSEWQYLLLVPLQAIGIVYSYQYLFKAACAIFGWVANIIGLALGTMNCCGVVIGLLLLVVLLGAVMNVIWIAGLVLMVWSLIRAFQQDGKVLRLPNTFPIGRKRLPGDRKVPGLEDEDSGWDDPDDDPRSSSGGSSWDDGGNDSWDEEDTWTEVDDSF